MKKNRITRRLSLKAKFKSMDLVELVIMDDKNNIQIELIPVKLVDEVLDKETESIENSVAEEGGAD